MKVQFFSVKNFEQPYLLEAKTESLSARFTTRALCRKTAGLAAGCDAVSILTADDADGNVLEALSALGIRYIAVRAAGFDNVDLEAATELGITVANVPEYSPYSVAEHAVAMILALNRKLVMANEQVHRHDFRVDNLIGFDLHGKTAGIVGTGRIGSIAAKILRGFGCRILAYDLINNYELENAYGARYCDAATLCANSDIISIHIPLNKATHHLFDRALFAQMKKGVLLVNTARGAVINTGDLIEFIGNGRIGHFGMDVYEKEKGVFFQDLSSEGLHDPVLEELMNFPNVLITPHQAFATREALANIAKTTFYNIDCWANRQMSGNELSWQTAVSPAGTGKDDCVHML